jgi:hypothetical protein
MQRCDLAARKEKLIEPAAGSDTAQNKQHTDKAIDSVPPLATGAAAIAWQQSSAAASTSSYL